ncbi:MAG TPA: FAD-binding oxidoreductase [Rhizomicrobium sp.]|nr:FAD-binding oxidoreductase [Rhizomicrobium sp.]
MDRRKIRWNGWGWNEAHDELSGRAELWTWLAHELGMPALLATPARELRDIDIPPSRLRGEERSRFVAILGAEQVCDDDYERAFHALGRSYHDMLRVRAGDLTTAPDLVLYARNQADVLAVLAYASEQGIAVVPYGGGTSVVGGVTADRGRFGAAVTLDLSKMDRVLDVDRISMTAEVEAGIYGPALEKALQTQGLTLGHYPQSFEFSTVGGWIAHAGAGQQSNRYGRSADWLVSVTLATPRGIFATDDFPASAAGPRLKDIVLGSEGAFGIVTQARVRIHESPSRKIYTGFLFPDFKSGTEAIRTATLENIPSAMLRLSDADETRIYRAMSDIGKPHGLKAALIDRFLAMKGLDRAPAALIAGFEGDAAEVSDALARFKKLARRLGALSAGESMGKRWYEGRFHGPYMRDPMMDRGVGVDTLETSTSWSNIARLHGAVTAALHAAMTETAPRPGARGIVMGHISHSYPDGASLYFTYIFPRRLDSEIAQWRAIKKDASDAIVANGGTISHHHGVGEDHLPWVAQEKGELGIAILRAIKHTLDPKGILNPGKLIPG